jgi:DNA-binding protein HU-beta
MKESFNQRQNFLNKLSSRLDCSSAEAEAYFDAVIAELKALLMRGESFTITGFGKFEVRKKPARIGRNPQTGCLMSIRIS